MASNLRNILSAPIDIYRASKEIFPETEASISQTQEGYHLQLKLNQNLSVTLNQSVDYIEFIAELVLKKRESKVFSNKKIEPDRFTMIEPSLTGWENFYRTIYEFSGKKCFDVFTEYLLTSENESLVIHLGFSPKQVEERFSQDDLDLFMSFMEKVKCLENEPRRKLISQFEQKYPLTFSKILKKYASISRKSNNLNLYEDFFSKIKAEVIGQDHVAASVATLLTSQTKKANSGVFLFVGPTGVGKTEMAKSISKIKSTKLVFFEMNQYTTEVDTNSFFGAPPGYVGSTDRPHLAKALDVVNPKLIVSNPQTYLVDNAVILFDEIEKAHSKVKQSLLKLLDEKSCTLRFTSNYENVTAKYEFQNTFFVITSNLYSELILEAFSKKSDPEKIAQMFTDWNVKMPIESSFSAEFLGRVSVMPFGPIPKGETYQKLLKIKMSSFVVNLKSELDCKDVVLENEEALFVYLENRLYRRGIDIRKVNDFFEKEIKGSIYKNMAQIGKLENIKFIISRDQKGLYIKCGTYIDFADRYSFGDEIRIT